MHTEAEDHDIASNNDGLAIARKSAPTPARDIISLVKNAAPGPGPGSSIEGHGRRWAGKSRRLATQRDVDR